MAFTYGTVNKCKTASGGAANIYEVRFGYELVELGQSSQNPPVSTIKLQLEVRSTSSSYYPYGYKQKTTIDGTQLAETTFDLRNANTWKVWGTRTIQVTHNNDGTYSAEKSGSFTTNCTGDRPKSGSASVTVSLPTVPRYTTISSFTVSKRNETSFTFNWQTADTIDYVWYSTNEGSSWTGYDVTDGTSGSFTVGGLSPNTTYKCKLRVRRKDSQLPTDSGTISQTTNAAPTHSVASKTETAMTINFSCDATVDYAWYSLDGGNWVDAWSGNATNGSYTITNLAASSTHSIVTIVRRASTQTTYGTASISQTTLQYPYVSGVGSSNLTIGNSQTLTLYNPLSRNCTVYMKKDSAGGTQLYSGTTSTTSITFTPTASTLYSSIPNAKYGNCVYYCVYDGHHVNTSSNNTYIVNEAINAPTLSSSSLTDTDTTIVNNLTGSADKIVLNASTLLISVTASPKNSATISSITINGSSQTVSNNTATLTIEKPTQSSFTVVITDSRGISTQTNVSIASGNIVNYIPLTIVGVGKRNQPTDGKINISSSGKYFNGNFGLANNELITEYRFAETGQSYPDTWTNLPNTTSEGTHTEAQLQLSGMDYTKSFSIQVRARDKIYTGNTIISTITVPKGNPVYWWNDNEFNINGSSMISKNLVVGNIRVKNLANVEQCHLENCVLNSDNSLTSKINNTYYCSVYVDYLKDYIFNNKGKSITFSIGQAIANRKVSVVIHGTRSGGATYQEFDSSLGARYISGTIANDFTSVSRIELRFNRYTSPFTDTTTVVRDLMFEIDTTTPSEYTLPQGLSYIVGKNANGNYIKYDSGTLICWNEVTPSVAMTESSAGFYRSGIISPFPNFPITFLERPQLFISTQCASQYVTFFLKAYPPSTTNANDLRIYGTWSSTQNVTISYLAIGKWK